MTYLLLPVAKKEKLLVNIGKILPLCYIHIGVFNGSRKGLILHKSPPLPLLVRLHWGFVLNRPWLILVSSCHGTRGLPQWILLYKWKEISIEKILRALMFQNWELVLCLKIDPSQCIHTSQCSYIERVQIGSGHNTEPKWNWIKLLLHFEF